MSKKNFLFLLAIITAVYLCAIGVDVMEPDAAQYASISREMKESKIYLQVYEHGRDYLDKPPFLFWASSVSMNLFGENNFGYKFPSILFALIAIYATYRFAKLFYDQKLAQLSAIVLASCQALFLITNDVRTDTILMSWVIIALWQIAEWVHSKKIIHFLLGSAAIGAGMLTKGPIALFVPVFAFGSHFLLQRKFNYLFRPVYLLGLLVIAVVLVPMSIGLYQQFDLHPEKTVNGFKNVSGLRFFYWTQSFGRISGESVWNNHAPFSYLFENLLWGMLPWTLFFVAGLIRNIVRVIQNKFRVPETHEFISTGGFLLTYCSLGISKYQLPHYIYVTLPLIAIITAKMLYDLFWQGKFKLLAKIIMQVQWIICAILLTVTVIILVYSFPAKTNWPWVIPITIVAASLFLFLKRSSAPKLFRISLVSIIGFNLFMALWVYPNILKYQAGSVAGRFVNEKQIEKDKFFTYKYSGSWHSLHFYSRRIVENTGSLDSLKAGFYLLTRKEGMDDVLNSGRSFSIVKQGMDYRASQLTWKFLSKETREQQGDAYYLVELK